MDTTPTPTANDGFMKRMLDVVEKAGNKVPHPAMIFHPAMVFLFLMAVVKAIVALMIPYVLAISVIWTLLFVVWFLLGLPWGL